jgi:DnaJ-domain-containing protein 1
MDHFALLDQPRLPWLDADALKAAFLRLSAQEHPDRVHTATDTERAAATGHYAELNAAHQCLREPGPRLLYMLELETGSPPPSVQNIPPETMDLFAEIGLACRETDRFLAAKAKAASPLLQAQFFVQGLERTDNLNALLGRIQLRRQELVAELKDMNAAWIAAPPPGSPSRAGALPLRRLEEIARQFTYTARWCAQIQERIAQLSF